MKKYFVLFMAMMLLVGCATAPPKISFLGEYSKNLAPGPEGGAKMRWLKPGVDFAKYNKVMVDYVVFTLADDSTSKVINGDEMKYLGDVASAVLINTIKEKYPVVAEPGPDVMRIRTAIVGIKKSRTTLSEVTTVMPVGLGISLIKKGSGGGWTGSGETQAEFMILDSTTSDVIAVASDEYSAGFMERFNEWESAEEAFKIWGGRFVKSLDAMKARK